MGMRAEPLVDLIPAQHDYHAVFAVDVAVGIIDLCYVVDINVVGLNLYDLNRKRDFMATRLDEEGDLVAIDHWFHADTVQRAASIHVGESAIELINHKDGSVVGIIHNQLHTQNVSQVRADLFSALDRLGDFCVNILQDKLGTLSQGSVANKENHRRTHYNM